MAKSLASIMSQIERLQKEAAAIQSEVIDRIQKEIAKYGLTAEQLFSQLPGAAKTKAAKAKPTKSKAAKPKVAKYADGAGNTWGGMGKRPAWLHQALAAGKALEDFLIGKTAAAPKKVAAKKATAKSTTAEAKPKTPAKKRATRNKSTPAAKKTRKSAAKPAQTASAAS